MQIERQTRSSYNDVTWHSWLLCKPESEEHWQSKTHAITVKLKKKFVILALFYRCLNGLCKSATIIHTGRRLKSLCQYNSLLPPTTEPFKILEIRDHILTIHESWMNDTILIDRETPVCSQYHQRWLKNQEPRLSFTTAHANRQNKFSYTRLLATR